MWVIEYMEDKNMKKDIAIRDIDSMGDMFALGHFSNIFEDVRRSIDNAFGNWKFDMLAFEELQPKGFFPKVNIIENESDYEVEIAVAGFDKDDVELELKDNAIFIKAEKNIDSDEENKKYLKREIAYRSFRRLINFPMEIDSTEVFAEYVNGVIKCRVGKVVSTAPDTVKIKINE